MASALAQQWNFNLPIAALASSRSGDWIAVALGDGSLRLLPANMDADAPKEMKLHDGVSLSLQPGPGDSTFLSGGDDGKVFIIDPAQGTPALLAECKNKWIDQVAATNGSCAYAAGKEIHLCDAAGKGKFTVPMPSSAGGLAFSPNGKRLAASHYNGVSLWWTNAKESAPAKLEWKGSHLGLIWHPDGKIVISAMQEASLHGWRLSDSNEMQMQGYAGKVRSMSFTAKGRYLATGGAAQAICWPFFGGGPWGKTPLMLGGSDGKLVTQVAANPKEDILAAGYEDGMIVLAPLDGRMEILIHPPVAEKGSGVAGLAWNAKGDCLFAALENGYLMLFTIESVQRAVKHA